MHRRLVPALSCAVTIVLGLAVDGLATGPVADKVGDVLYACLAVLGLWFLHPRAPLRWLAAGALVWCVGVELLQLSDLPGALASWAPWVRLVLGSGFDALDLPAYAAGCLLGASVVAAARRTRPVPAATPPPHVHG